MIYVLRLVMAENNLLFVEPGLGGWAYVGVPGFAGRIYVRAALGRIPTPEEPEIHIPRAALKVVDLVIDGEGRSIGAPFLRELPLGAIETLLNKPSTYQRLLDRLDESADHLNVTNSMSHFQVLKTNTGKAQRPTRLKENSSPRPRLARPGTRPLRDEFLRQVADFYVDAVTKGERPLVAIEHEASVPRNTAAGWVTQARRRGFLATDPSVKDSRKESSDGKKNKRSKKTSRQ